VIVIEGVIERVVEEHGTCVVCYSGGKDSTAALAWCVEHLASQMQVAAVLADTGLEPPESRAYVAEVSSLVGVDVVWCDEPYRYRDGSVVRDAFDVARRRGRFPRPDLCEWRAVLKRDRLRVWLRRQGFDRPVWVMGHRREENAYREVLPYLRDEEKFVQRYGAPVFCPLLDWSVGDVLWYLDARGLPLHPAYGYGLDRVGCVGCVNSTVGSMELYASLPGYREILLRLYELEQEIGWTWGRRDSLGRWLEGG